ncbi:hypothetical protein NXX77_00270 [Phocaeicola dorei]|nr:hypothetical protein [Phocaeicola dorei]
MRQIQIQTYIQGEFVNDESVYPAVQGKAMTISLSTNDNEVQGN